MVFRRIGLVAAAVTLAASAATAEVCHQGSGGQFADVRTCVSSVLPPQGNNDYGPKQIAAAAEGTWCEGVPGPGIGQTVTLHQKPAQKVGTLMFVNGYTKSKDTFRANGRVKRARIETNLGFSKVVTLKDSDDMQDIKIKPARFNWVRMTILEVYPGARHEDTCISKFYPNHEEFGM